MDKLKKTVLIEFITKGDTDIDKKMKNLESAVKKVGESTDKTSKNIDQMGEGGAISTNKLAVGFGKAMIAVEILKGGVQLIGQVIQKVFSTAIVAIQGLTTEAYKFSKSSVENAMQIEKYETALKVMLGTTEKAQKRLKELSEFAEKTPFELPQVIELGNQLQALGRYSKENMTMLGDLAAASGKPIEQVTGAFAKLVSGQKGIAVDMFRDLLITTEDWSKATGKGVSKTGELLATTEEMVKALPKIIGKKGFAGMMDEQSKTLDGVISNLRDNVFRLQTEFAQKTGLFDFVKQSAQSVLSFMTEWSPKVIAYVLQVKDFIAGWWNEMQGDVQPKIDAIMVSLWGQDGNGGLKGALISLLNPSVEVKEAIKKMMSEGLNILIDNLPGLIENVKKLIDNLNKPGTIDNMTKSLENINTTFGHINNAVSWLIDNWNNLKKVADTVYSINRSAQSVATGGASEGLRSLIQTFKDKAGYKAVGGLINKTGIYNVGEQGMEQVVLPRGAKVIPNQQIQQASANTINVNINAPVYGVNQLQEMVISAVNQAQKNQNYLSNYNLL